VWEEDLCDFLSVTEGLGRLQALTHHVCFGLEIEALERAGVDDRDVFRETASGAKRDRDQLRRVLDLLSAGDRLCVYRLDRLAPSQLHLLQIIE
jgi:DNA invertase Pin-like site-specific DNA recombinase